MLKKSLTQPMRALRGWYNLGTLFYAIKIKDVSLIQKILDQHPEFLRKKDKLGRRFLTLLVENIKNPEQLYAILHLVLTKYPKFIKTQEDRLIYKMLAQSDPKSSPFPPGDVRQPIIHLLENAEDKPSNERRSPATSFFEKIKAIVYFVFKISPLPIEAVHPLDSVLPKQGPTPCAEKPEDLKTDPFKVKPILKAMDDKPAITPAFDTLLAPPISKEGADSEKIPPAIVSSSAPAKPP